MDPTFFYVLCIITLLVILVYSLVPPKQRVPLGTFYKQTTTPNIVDNYILMKKDSLDLVTIPNKSPEDFTIEERLPFTVTNLVLNKEPVIRLDKNNALIGFTNLSDKRELLYDLELQANNPVETGTTSIYRRLSPQIFTRGQMVSNTMKR